MNLKQRKEIILSDNATRCAHVIQSVEFCRIVEKSMEINNFIVSKFVSNEFNISFRFWLVHKVCNVRSMDHCMVEKRYSTHSNISWKLNRFRHEFDVHTSSLRSYDLSVWMNCLKIRYWQIQIASLQKT